METEATAASPQGQAGLSPDQSPIRKYFDICDFDDIELPGTEVSFMVPIDGTWDEDLGEPHYLAGSIDRLVVRHYRRQPVVGVDAMRSCRRAKHPCVIPVLRLPSAAGVAEGGAAG